MNTLTVVLLSFITITGPLPIIPGPPASYFDLPIVAWEIERSTPVNGCLLELDVTVARGGCWLRPDGYYDCAIDVRGDLWYQRTCVKRPIRRRN